MFDIERIDRYGRMLADVYRLSDGLFVNAALVADGFAQVATFLPNVAHVEELAELAGEARDAGRGLWSASEGVSSARAPVTVPPTTAVSAASLGSTGCDPSYPGE